MDKKLKFKLFLIAIGFLRHTTLSIFVYST